MNLVLKGSMTPQHYPYVFGHLGEVPRWPFFFPLKGEAKVPEGTEEAPPPSANDIDRSTKTRPGWRVVKQINLT